MWFKQFLCWFLDVLDFFITLIGLMLVVAAVWNFFAWLSAKSM